MIRVIIESKTSIEDLMILVFRNEYENCNDTGKKMFNDDYPDWNNKENIRNYFYNAFEVEDEIKSYFRLADKKDKKGLQELLDLGTLPPYETYLVNALLSVIS